MGLLTVTLDSLIRGILVVNYRLAGACSQKEFLHWVRLVHCASETEVITPLTHWCLRYRGKVPYDW